MRPMVSGERLVLSTLLAGIYLPGIDELYVSSRKSYGRPQSHDGARETRHTYTLKSIDPVDLPGKIEFCSDSFRGLPHWKHDRALHVVSPSVLTTTFDGSKTEALRSLPRHVWPDMVAEPRDADYRAAPQGGAEVQDSLTLYGGGARLLDLLREKSPTLAAAPELLKKYGFASEAARLERPGLLDLARQFVLEGAALTPFHPEAEWIWQECPALPHALWCSFPQGAKTQHGTAAEFPRRLIAVVGSRDVAPAGAAGAKAAALALHQGGWTLITGGAVGVDTIALDAVGETLTPRGVVLQPQGLSTAAGQRLRRRWPWAWHLSLCAPWQEFEGRWAHQRNRFIFCLGQAAVSIGPRYRRGGTWSGAMECLRGRLAPLAYLSDVGDKEALTVLKNLGAFEVCLADLAGNRGPDLIAQLVLEGQRRLSGAMPRTGGQGSLFDSENPARTRSDRPPEVKAEPEKAREKQLPYRNRVSPRMTDSRSGARCSLDAGSEPVTYSIGG